MNILITNDDGIRAEGIKKLKEALDKAGHNTLVSAPDSERSATGHAITLRIPIWSKETYFDKVFFGYATSGTPADSVKLGLLQFTNDKIDLVISGINCGANLGTDIPYSGTVSGALEGAIMGYPSIAVSSLNPVNPHFETAGQFIVSFLEKFDLKLIPPFGALNINVPSVDYKDLKGYKITKQGSRKYDDFFEMRKDPYGNSYYWLMGTILEEDPAEGGDQFAVMEHFVSITPLTVFMNDNILYDKLKGLNF